MTAVLALMTPAVADERLVDDRAKASGRLDIAAVAHGHKIGSDGHPRLVHRIQMHEPWRSRALQGDDRFIWIPFDVREDRGYDGYSGVTEREVMIDFNKGKLRATLFNHLGDPPKPLASLPVWRANRTTVVFTIGPRQLRRHGELKRYEWGTASFWSRSGDAECPQRDPCSDFAPNRPSGYVVHEL